ncbi:unnamed protein product, partial [Linum tenue]
QFYHVLLASTLWFPERTLPPHKALGSTIMRNFSNCKWQARNLLSCILLKKNA